MQDILCPVCGGSSEYTHTHGMVAFYRCRSCGSQGSEYPPLAIDDDDIHVDADELLEQDTKYDNWE